MKATLATLDEDNTCHANSHHTHIHCNGQDMNNNPYNINISVAKDSSWIDWAGQIKLAKKSTYQWLYEEMRETGTLGAYKITIAFEPRRLRVSVHIEPKKDERKKYFHSYNLECFPFKNSFNK